MDEELQLWTTKPETPAGRYLRVFWHPVYVSENLKPAKAVPVRIMNQDFTLYRAENGSAYAVAFRCAHDNTGQCVEQPGEDPRFAEKVRIRTYPIEEYLGLGRSHEGQEAMRVRLDSGFC